MKPEIAQSSLDVLIENARRILAAGFGNDRAEATFFEIVGLLRAESLLRDYVLARIRETMRAEEPGALAPGLMPPELIELIAHEFRWPELKDIADQRIADLFDGDPSLAIGDIAHDITEAMQDNWRDREFYRHYTH